MNFKKWVKSIQTAGFNGARTYRNRNSTDQNFQTFEIYTLGSNLFLEVQFGPSELSFLYDTFDRIVSMGGVATKTTQLTIFSLFKYI